MSTVEATTMMIQLPESDARVDEAHLAAPSGSRIPGNGSAMFPQAFRTRSSVRSRHSPGSPCLPEAT